VLKQLEATVRSIRASPYNPVLATQRIRFGRKTNEIATFSVLDEKDKIHNLGRNLDKKLEILDEIGDFRRHFGQDNSCVPKHAG